MRFPRRRLLAPVTLMAVMCISACATPRMRSTLDRRPTAAEMARLWVKPDDITSRDLFWGFGGQKWAPKPGSTFEVEEIDETGASGGWDVKDTTTGVEYSVKIGPESQTEVVLSRFLWAVGYHQPPTYLLTDYTLTGAPAGDVPLTGRFRPKLGDELADNVGDWSWHENPYVGTRELKGLLVMQLLFNNWDLKTSQNKIYEVVKPAGGPDQWYVVRDIGAALGRTGWPIGTKNNPDDFEKQQLIEGVEGRIVDFDYDARHKELFKDITVDDVIWIAELMNQLTPKQYADAFRAAAYPEEIANRFITKLRAKVQEGLALKTRARATR